jgi:hypothetical protein
VTEGSIVEPLRIGVLGAGRITSLSLVAPARSTGHRLVAVAARWSVRAAVFAAEAAAAGFTGFGLLSDDLPAAVAEYGLPGIRTMLADNGIVHVHVDLESIPYWWD